MSHLVAFLIARLDEDERIALDAGEDDTARSWTGRSNGYEDSGHVFDGHGTTVVYDEGRPNTAEAVHIGRHDPARVLRGVEAKRAIVASLAKDLRLGARTDLTQGGQIALWVTCKRLASVYRDHPDYDPAWSPVSLPVPRDTGTTEEQ